ncbi:hypothetical protein BHM03_00029354, partial [Ensete ventricosum]
ARKQRPNLLLLLLPLTHQSFWPSIVMRKWLNIKPKVHEFSEDEADTESSDDDGQQLVFFTRFLELAVHVVCVWIILPDFTRIIFLCSFQEVVPLNAGNVLGAEDNRPIQEWEAIIRRTLNKSLQPKTLCKSYTAPPSPASISPSPDDDPHTHTDGTQEEDQTDQTRLLKEFKLDWPEHSFDAPPPVLVSGKRLRRVLSSSARIGLEEAQVYAGLRRVCQSSGNLGMIWPEQQEASDVLDPIDDMSKPSSRYFRVVSKQMVGVYVSVWVCRRLRRHVNNLKVSPVGVGLMGYMGNKGSVSVSMTLFQTRLCFVCSHLTSGHTEADQQKRNSDVHDILHRTRFASLGAADHPQTIPSHECDRILFLGKGIKQESYGRSEVNLSDHRPVSSVFLVEVEVLDQRKLERLLISGMDMQFLKSNLGGNRTDTTVWDAAVNAVIVKCRVKVGNRIFKWSTHPTKKSTSSSTIAHKTSHGFFLLGELDQALFPRLFFVVLIGQRYLNLDPRRDEEGKQPVETITTIPLKKMTRVEFWQLKMDCDSNKISPEKEVSLEFVRESLMAISQSLPDVILAPNGFPVKAPVAADAVGDQNIGNGAEEYRSKLISISSMQPPDVKPSPSIVENLGV